MYLESANGIGAVGTRPLLWNGGNLEVNAQSQNGYAKVQVLGSDLRPLAGFSFADCMPFSGDRVDWIPTWKSGAALGLLAGKPVRFEVELHSARPYTLRGDFRVMTQHDAALLQDKGIFPPDRTEFF